MPAATVAEPVATRTSPATNRASNENRNTTAVDDIADQVGHGCLVT
jgi:hypothetical protein